MLVCLRSPRHEATLLFIPNRSINVLDPTDLVCQAIESFLPPVAGRGVTWAIQWVIGASLPPPTVFIRALSTQRPIRMAAFGCMVKRQQNFTRWYALGLRSISLLRSPKTQRSGRKCNG